MLTSVLQKECEGCQSHLSPSLGAKLAPTPHRDTLAGRAPKNSGPAAQFLLVVIGSMLVWICRLAKLQSVDIFAKGSFLKVNSTSQSISFFNILRPKLNMTGFWTCVLLPRSYMNRLIYFTTTYQLISTDLGPFDTEISIKRAVHEV